MRETNTIKKKKKKRNKEKESKILYENGYTKANLYAARAGFSEHQLGTAIDLANIYTIEETDEEYIINSRTWRRKRCNI